MEQLEQNQAIEKKDIPAGWSIEAIDFINKLLEIRPEKRLGYKGVEELKNHSWLKHFPWESLRKKEIESPFVSFSEPECSEKSCCNLDQDDEIYLKSIKENEKLLKQGLLHQLF